MIVRQILFRKTRHVNFIALRTTTRLIPIRSKRKLTVNANLQGAVGRKEQNFPARDHVVIPRHFLQKPIIISRS